MRIPRENLLNAVADVTAEGKYVSPISDPDQVSTGCASQSVTVRSVTAVWKSKSS